MATLLLLGCEDDPRDSTLPRTLVVAADGTGAFTDVQSAIDEARDGDEILVRSGEYVVSRPLTFNTQAGVAPPGRPKDFRLRSESGPASTVLRMAEDPAEGSVASVFWFGSGESPASVVEGFTITGGLGTGSRAGSARRRSGDSGGGVYCSAGSSPTFVDCSLVANSCRLRGGGVFCDSGASPTFRRCEFRDNVADGGVVSGLELWFNGRGGGLYAGRGCAPVLESCRLLGNAVQGDGGAAACEDGAEATFLQCEISGNVATCGGGVSSDAASVRLDRCVLSGNLARTISDGAGLYLSGGGAVRCKAGSAELVNCVLSANCARGYCSDWHEQCAGGEGGAALAEQGSRIRLVHCTIADNAGIFQGTAEGPILGGVQCHPGGEALSVGCIYWNNVPGEDCHQGSGSCDLTTEDPLFQRTGAFDFERIRQDGTQLPDFVTEVPDYHLGEGSPAIGHCPATPGLAEDLDGRPRSPGPWSTAGAYEFWTS